MRLKTIPLLALVLFPLFAFAETPDELYRAGKFKEAAAALQNAWDQSSKLSAATAYNAGTSWAQAGDFARAYSLFLVAERLAPLDRDIKNNLAFVREKLPEDAKNIVPVFLFGVSIAELSPFSDYLWGIIAFVCFGFFFYGTLTGRLIRESKIAGILGLIAAVPFILIFIENRIDTAVVTQPSEIRSGPAASFSSIRALPSGAWISLMESENGWRKIRFISLREKKETVGWINSADLSLL
jgi:tetratricopeptide (TPR) repeat protein